ncbi:hypothetical protein ACWDV7_26360 [Streptomyces sp. NPDC003362]
MTICDPLTLLRALDAVAASYDAGELAYLALTSKPEHAIRDRMAWALQTSLHGCVVAREWNSPRGRIDLAVLDGSGTLPLALLEIKAAYTFDFAAEDLGSARSYRARVAADLVKATSALHMGQDSAAYALLLLTHPLGTPDQGGTAVKYLNGIRSSLRAQDQSALRTKAWQTVTASLCSLGPLHHGALEGGHAFGTEVHILYWLIGPVPPAAGALPPYRPVAGNHQGPRPTL